MRARFWGWTVSVVILLAVSPILVTPLTGADTAAPAFDRDDPTNRLAELGDDIGRDRPDPKSVVQEIGAEESDSEDAVHSTLTDPSINSGRSFEFCIDLEKLACADDEIKNAAPRMTKAPRSKARPPVERGQQSDPGQELWTNGVRPATEGSSSSDPDPRPPGYGPRWRESSQAPGRVPTTDPGQALSITVYLAPLSGLVAFLLYRRLTRDEVLDNELRSRILKIVTDEPGTTPSDLTDTLDVSIAGVLYHVRVLVKHDYLLARRADGRITLFAKGANDRDEHDLFSSMQSRAKRAVLDVVFENPGIGLSEAARRLDKDPSTVKYHADALIERGLIADVSEGHGRSLVVEATYWERLQAARGT